MGSGWWRGLGGGGCGGNRAGPLPCWVCDRGNSGVHGSAQKSGMCLLLRESVGLLVLCGLQGGVPQAIPLLWRAPSGQAARVAAAGASCLQLASLLASLLGSAPNPVRCSVWRRRPRLSVALLVRNSMPSEHLRRRDLLVAFAAGARSERKYCAFFRGRLGPMAVLLPGLLAARLAARLAAGESRDIDGGAEGRAPTRRP